MVIVLNSLMDSNLLSEVSHRDTIKTIQGGICEVVIYDLALDVHLLAQLADIISTRCEQIYVGESESVNVQGHHMLVEIIILGLGDMSQLELAIGQKLLRSLILNLNADMGLLSLFREIYLLRVDEHILSLVVRGGSAYFG